jgi:hypothetical protein
MRIFGTNWKIGVLYIIALIRQKLCAENFKPNPHTIGRWSREYMTNIYFVRVCELLASLLKWHVLPIVYSQKTTILCLMPKRGKQNFGSYHSDNKPMWVWSLAFIQHLVGLPMPITHPKMSRCLLCNYNWKGEEKQSMLW